MKRTTVPEKIEWTNFRWFDAPDKNTPRILLIGDSIVVGHGQMLHEALYPAYAVDYFATSLGVSDVEYRAHLEFILSRQDYAAIVFNNTLHAFDVDDSVYAHFLREEFLFLKKKTPKLFWRNGTPQRVPGESGTPHPKFDPRIRRRNLDAAVIAAELGVSVLDLFSEMMNHLDFLAADGVHYLPEGNAHHAAFLAKRLKEGMKA